MVVLTLALTIVASVAFVCVLRLYDSLDQHKIIQDRNNFLWECGMGNRKAIERYLADDSVDEEDLWEGFRRAATRFNLEPDFYFVFPENRPDIFTREKMMEEFIELYQEADERDGFIVQEGFIEFILNRLGDVESSLFNLCFLQNPRRKCFIKQLHKRILRTQQECEKQSARLESYQHYVNSFDDDI